MSLNLFIIGPSGCGKSTQAQLIAEKYNLTHLSTGQLLRDEMANHTEIGLKVKKYMDQGIWVPDEIVIALLEEKLNQINNQNFIVDGFPRMLHQVITIEEYLNSKSVPFSSVILLDVTLEEINARRQKKPDFQESDRTDNSSQAIAQRQKSYNETVNPIIQYLKSKNKLIVIDGNRPIEPIFNDISQQIDKL